MGPCHSAAIRAATGVVVVGHAPEELSREGVMGHDKELESLK